MRKRLFGLIAIALTLLTVPALAQDPADARSKLTQAKEQERSLLSELAVIDQGLSVLQNEYEVSTHKLKKSPLNKSNNSNN